MIKQFYLTHRTLTGSTISGQSGTGSNGNQRVLHIPHAFRTGASQLDTWLSYPGNLGGVWSPLQPSTTLADWVFKNEEREKMMLVIFFFDEESEILL